MFVLSQEPEILVLALVTICHNDLFLWYIYIVKFLFSIMFLKYNYCSLPLCSISSNDGHFDQLTYNQGTLRINQVDFGLRG